MLRDTKSVLSCFHPATTARSAFNWAVVSSRRVFLSESSWQWQLANDVVTMIFSCAKKQFPDMPIKCVFFFSMSMIICLLAIMIIMIVDIFILKIMDDDGHGDFFPRWSMEILAFTELPALVFCSTKKLFKSVCSFCSVDIILPQDPLSSTSFSYLWHPVATCNLRHGSYIYWL